MPGLAQLGRNLEQRASDRRASVPLHPALTPVLQGSLFDGRDGELRKSVDAQRARDVPQAARRVPDDHGVLVIEKQVQTYVDVVRDRTLGPLGFEAQILQGATGEEKDLRVLCMHARQQSARATALKQQRLGRLRIVVDGV
jgi:hypothetical protein